MQEKEACVSLEDVKSYLGLDDIEDQFVKKNIIRQINVAELYLEDAIGENYPRDDERAKELALMLVGDMYDNRSTKEVSSNTRKLFNQMCLQLKLKLIREKKDGIR